MSEKTPNPLTLPSDLSTLNDPDAWVAACVTWLKASAVLLVDTPAAVDVLTITGVQSTIFELRVDPEDVRRIIGRKGRTADALRDLLVNLGARIERRFLLEIIEPDVPPGQDPVGPRAREGSRAARGVTVKRVSASLI